MSTLCIFKSSLNYHGAYYTNKLLVFSTLIAFFLKMICSHSFLVFLSNKHDIEEVRTQMDSQRVPITLHFKSVLNISSPEYYGVLYMVLLK